ncbi:MAG: DUF2924 domain-containing protein [Planctomycetales bacterium]|nr:DUF2924 domain-containing protein [bacterium]UNM08190.1 MAG: DUF2924 domain-containing protein [Planctomycetales bacterium]
MNDKVLVALAELEKSSTEDLKIRWVELMGTEPPAYSRSHLIRRLSYRVQELMHGAVSEVLRGQLHRALEEQRVDPLDGFTFLQKGKPEQQKRWLPPAGTKYKRVHKGQEYTLTILDRGVDVNGKKYLSPSAAASVIAGNRKNGRKWWGIPT